MPIGRNYRLWTPTLSFTSPGSSSWAYTVQVGRLSRNGQRVTLSFAVTATLTKGTASGDLLLAGLPYNVFNTGTDLFAGDVSFSTNFATPPVALLARNNSTSAYVMKTTAGAMTAADVVDATQYTIRGEISYEV